MAGREGASRPAFTIAGGGTRKFNRTLYTECSMLCLTSRRSTSSSKSQFLVTSLRGDPGVYRLEDSGAKAACPPWRYRNGARAWNGPHCSGGCEFF